MCKKANFKTWWEASERLKEIAKTSKEDKVPQSYYKCLECNYWHLTSIDNNTRAIRNQKIDKKVESREKGFINREAEFWSKKFDIK